MATKINAAELVGKGIVSAYKLTNSPTNDDLVVVFATTDFETVIECHKNKIGAFAYIDPSMDEVRSVFVQTVIDAVFDADPVIYKDTPKFRPIAMECPVASTKTVYGFLAGKGCVENEAAAKILKDAGYSVLKKELKTAFGHRDYSEAAKDPENQEIIKKDREMLEKIGATYESLNEETKKAYEEIENGTSSGIIFEGPTGTGKSFTARILAVKAGAPMFTIGICNGTVVEDLIGTFIPNDDPTSDSKWRFVEGPLLKAYYKGYIFCGEEINCGNTGVLAVLNQFSDGTPRVFINGKMYERHPNFVMYMTMNPGYDGTDPLNVALKNRFAKVNVPALSKKEFSRRCCLYSKSLGHELSAEFFNALFDFAGTIEAVAKSSQWHENVKFSIRNAQGLCHGILAKKRTLAEFEALIAVHYLNDLACDNDNSDALEKYKKLTEIKSQIAAIYKLYDFAEAKPVKVTTSFDELTMMLSRDPVHEEKTSAMVDDIFKGFEYYTVDCFTGSYVKGGK